MSDPKVDTVAASPVAQTATPGFVFSDAQFQALLAAAKGTPSVGMIPAVVADVAAVNADVIARIEQVIADAKATASKTHGAAKALQADVKANWPLLLIGALAVASFAMHFVKVFGFGG